MKTFEVTVQCQSYTFILAARDQVEAERAVRGITMDDLSDWDLRAQFDPLREVASPPEMAVGSVHGDRIVDAADVYEAPPPPTWIVPGVRARVRPIACSLYPGSTASEAQGGEGEVEGVPRLEQGHRYVVRLKGRKFPVALERLAQVAP